MSPNLLYSIHDRDSFPHIPAGGYCVDAVLVSDEPPNYGQIRSDINWIVRLNHGWAPNGTIPLAGQYDEFAKRCAMFASRAKGANVFIIGNEPNHAQERPHGVKIEPEAYAECFNLCYKAITYERPDAEVCVAAVAPWDVTHGMDWISYYRRMLESIIDCDGLAIHGYTHGADPNLIWSEEKVQGWYWHFPVIFQTIQAIPAKFANRPVHVTECDQGDNAWLDVNSGYVRNAYSEVHEWNRHTGNQGIHSLTLYRWRGDKYELHNKPQVMADFSQAVAMGYRSPPSQVDTTPPFPVGPETPEVPPEVDLTPPPAPGPGEPTRTIDPRLLARGVTFDFAGGPQGAPAGTWYWRMTDAHWLDEEEADAVGPDHHILGSTMLGGVQKANVPLRVSWPSGSTLIHSKAAQPSAIYNYDYPMSSSLNEFSIWVDDGSRPSDKVSGIGMGKLGNPSIHTSTWIDWQLVQVTETVRPPEPEPPTPTPPAERLIWPVTGPVTQFFGSHGIAYPGSAGHDGMDFAVVTGTPVLAVADGVVKWVGNDAGGFGEYVRIFHPEYGFHSFYAHLSDIDVQVGQPVKRGDTIGESGNTGRSSGPHLHYSCRIGEEDDYYELHDGYQNGCANPLAVYALINRVDPNSTLVSRG